MVKQSAWKQSISSKTISFDPETPERLKPPSMYLIKSGEFFQCKDKESICRLCWALLEETERESKLIGKSYILKCQGIMIPVKRKYPRLKQG